ncbi:hypothetical protein ABZ297_31595, partial [Nonomuraea sp. NPDC005983]
HVRFAATPADLGPLLSPLRRVEAPVPPLVRQVGGATLVYLQAAFPTASRVSVERPDERGADQGWDSATIDFDPARYTTEMPVRVRGVAGTPLLVDPFGGGVRALASTVDGEYTEVVVPFDAGPAALLVFTGEQAPPASPPSPPTQESDLSTGWDMELVPTLDDTWGDLGHSGPVLQRWEVQHRVDGHPEWHPVHATFGPHGTWRVTPGDGPAGAGEWRPAVFSTSRGIRKDPIHRLFLGPKGHVPEEFLDFGQVTAGQAAWFRAELTVPDQGFLAVGAAAAKTVRVDGREVELDDRGYLALARRPLRPGRYLLEVRLAPETDGRLRAHLAVVTDPGRYLRPEWIAAPAGPTDLTATPAGTTQQTTSLVGTAELSATFTPKGTVLQVASTTACQVLVNGVDMGRQGGFDPYTDQRKPRARRYDLAGVLRPGENEVTVRVADAAEPVLVDGCTTSGPGWWAVRDGERVLAEVRRTQHHDPAALHLPRRPHPLPGASWLSPTDTTPPAAPSGGGPTGTTSPGTPRGDRPTGSVVLPVVLTEEGTAGRVEWLRFEVPPGATALRVPLRGTARLLVDGAAPAEGSGCLRVPLDGRAGPREAVLRVETEAGHSGGAILTGPIEFETGPGPIELGDWERSGLPEYSGGVRYRRTVYFGERPGSGLLDLGRVRGTAEVRVNGVPCGVRVCSPYRFDVGAALRPGENVVEVEVYGTLAPYLDATSPTHFVFPGQRVTGLSGPVRLLFGARRKVHGLVWT